MSSTCRAISSGVAHSCWHFWQVIGYVGIGVELGAVVAAAGAAGAVRGDGDGDGIGRRGAVTRNGAGGELEDTTSAGRIGGVLGTEGAKVGTETVVGGRFG